MRERDTAPDDLAIRLEGVTKTYRVFDSLVDQALDVFGLRGLFFWRRRPYKEVHALRAVDLVVERGDRLAIVGRNGAGKTTLLKLVTGNFAPSSGAVRVQGSVQALMNVGLGFHPEFTGYENVRSAMLYNGLPADRFDAALADVIEFAELGDFLYQPVKNYSLGMRTRLMFATATAIEPDILIVDEVLGAGDAYFAGKSAARMQKLVSSGCTVLLVSHSMQEVLQYCDKAIWLEKGEVVLSGEALAVVKAYEEFIHELEAGERRQRAARSDPAGDGASATERGPGDWMDQRILEQVLGAESARQYTGARGAVSSGGVSRWAGEEGVRIRSVVFRDSAGRECDVFRTGETLRITIEAAAQRDGAFPCSFFLALFDDAGRWLARFHTDEKVLNLRAGESHAATLELDPLLLGNGEYLWSVAAYAHLDLARVSTARHYDILTRSFRIKVADEHRDDASILHHPHRWIEGS
jgi:homopolymeric O-antigen transport system ATP-binding protein